MFKSNGFIWKPVGSEWTVDHIPAYTIFIENPLLSILWLLCPRGFHKKRIVDAVPSIPPIPWQYVSVRVYRSWRYYYLLHFHLNSIRKSVSEWYARGASLYCQITAATLPDTKQFTVNKTSFLWIAARTSGPHFI